MRESGPLVGQRARRTSTTSTTAVSWGYEPHNGPALRGTLDRAFSACALGAEQSPIDLSGGRRIDLALAWAHLPSDPAAPRVVVGELDLTSLQPSCRTTWRYRGSLTTPHCTEGIAWIIPAEPLSMSAAQITSLAAIHPHDCQAVQPLGERALYRG